MIFKLLYIFIASQVLLENHNRDFLFCPNFLAKNIISRLRQTSAYFINFLRQEIVFLVLVMNVDIE